MSPSHSHMWAQSKVRKKNISYHVNSATEPDQDAGEMNSGSSSSIRHGDTHGHQSAQSKRMPRPHTSTLPRTPMVFQDGHLSGREMASSQRHHTPPAAVTAADSRHGDLRGPQ